MKSITGVRAAVLSSAFKFDSITHASGITPEMENDATVVASNLPLYASVRREDAFRLSFVLLGQFQKGSPQHEDISKFLDQTAVTPSLKPLAEAAIQSLYAGPKRPDAAAHEAADFLARHLPRLRALDSVMAEIATDSLLMHSDARPQRKEGAAQVKCETIDREFGKDPVTASESANWAIVSGGPKLTPSTRSLLAFQVNNLDAVSAKEDGAERRTPLLVLYYATPGSKGQRWAEDQLSSALENTRRDNTLDGRNEALQIAWALAEAGDRGREPTRAAQRFLRSIVPDRDNVVGALLGAGESERVDRANITRKKQRDTVRTEQAKILSSSAKGNLRDLMAGSFGDNGPQNRMH